MHNPSTVAYCLGKLSWSLRLIHPNRDVLMAVDNTNRFFVSVKNDRICFQAELLGADLGEKLDIMRSILTSHVITKKTSKLTSLCLNIITSSFVLQTSRHFLTFQ